MGLTIINETVTSLCKTKHSFSDGEKEFVVQFAFKSGDKIGRASCRERV